MLSKIGLRYEDDVWLHYEYGYARHYSADFDLDGYILVKKEYLEEFKKGNKISLKEAEEKGLLLLTNSSSFMAQEENEIDPEIIRYMMKIVMAYVKYDAIYLKDKIIKNQDKKGDA